MSLIGVIFATALAGSAPGAPVFHPAKTAPEIALDKALKHIEANDRFVVVDAKHPVTVAQIQAQPVAAESVIDDILGRPGGDGRHDYETWLTPKLVTALRGLETKARDGCDYRQSQIDGYICGLDYDPISCAQDFAETYGYRTVSQDASKAVIAFTDLTNMSGWGVTTYTLTKDRSGWRIDAIACRP